MNRHDYDQLKIESRPLLKANDFVAYRKSFTLLTFTLALFYTSHIGNFAVWLFSQIILSIFLIQWFVLLHDYGHNNYFSNKKMNSIFGHVASVFTILPFYPWRFIHRDHHKWTGWKEKDPTMTIIIPKDLKKSKKCIINFCWKYWIPIFTLSFSFSNFWNIKKLYSYFPDKATFFKNMFSIFFLPIVYIFTILILTPPVFFKNWILAYSLFLIICDPLLLSQHSAVPQNLGFTDETAPIAFKDQDEYTRSLIFPLWVTKYVLLGFDRHGIHHVFPTMPGYNIWKVQTSTTGEENWLTWLKWAKGTKAHKLLFSSELNLKNDYFIKER